MSAGGVETVPGEQPCLLAKLERLLNEQIALARRGDFSASETLAEKSGTIIEKIGQTGAVEQSERKEQIERLLKSYRTVILSLAAEKDRLEKQLQQIGQGRKTLRAYRGHG
jgi:hypothetical protein